MEARATRVAAALLAAAGRRGARVALVLEEYDQFFVCMLGAWLAGQVVVPLNTSLPQHDVDWLLGKSQPDVIVLPDDEACPTAEGGPVRLVVTADADGLVDGVRAAGGEAAPAVPADELEAVARGRAGDDHVHVRHHGPAQGRLPDAAGRLEQRRQRGARRSGSRPTTASSSTRRRTSPAASATSSRCWPNGGGVAGQLGFYFGTGLLDEMENEGCTGFGGAPAHLVRVVEPMEEPREHPFRFWVSSGDHLPLPVIEKFRRVLPGVGLFNMYGLTEVSGRLCVLPPAELDVKVGSVGRPIGDMRVVARRGDLTEAAPGEQGELYVTGSLLMQGYLDEPEITAKTLTAHGLKTGDFGKVDESGAVWIAGRKDDIIKRGGEKVSIIHVQEALQGLGRFADVAVVAAPDEILGHVPVAFVVPHEPDGFKASKLLRELRGVLPSTSLPSRVIAVEAIPRTGSGKAIRAELQTLLAEELG